MNPDTVESIVQFRMLRQQRRHHIRYLLAGRGRIPQFRSLRGARCVMHIQIETAELRRSVDSGNLKSSAPPRSA